MTPQTIAGMNINSLENMNEDIIPQRQVVTIFTLTFTNTHFWRKSPPRPVINVASGRTNERRSCSPYGFDRLQRNPEDHPHGTVSVRQQGRLRGKLQICHLPVIRRINEHVDVAPPPQISLCFISTPRRALRMRRGYIAQL